MKFLSFSKRLTRRIVYAVFFMMGIIAVISFITAMEVTISETKGRYLGIMRTSNEKIEKLLVEYVVATRIVRNEIEQNIDSPEAVMTTLKQELKVNPNILGYFAAFDADFYPQKGHWFAPLAISRGGGKSELMLMGSEQCDYLNKAWYQQGLKADKGIFMEPYYDEEGAKQVVVSYLQAIHDKDGRPIGVIGAYIAWGWLQMRLQQIERNSNSTGLLDIDEDDNKSLFYHTFIVGPSGNYILYQDKEYIEDENFFKEAAVTPDTLDDYVCRQIREGEHGMAIMKVNGKSSLVLYHDIKYTDWSIVMVVPENALYAPGVILGLILFGFILLGVQAIYWICHSTIRRSTRSLHALAKSADEVAKGNFNVPLPEIQHNDEIRQLRDSFGNMQHSLSSFIEQLKTTTAEKAAIENELTIASEIQKALLPHTFPEREDICLYGSVKPAKGVGGDLFDFFFREGKLFFCIGDVVGKGVSAALLMTVTKSLFRAYSDNEDRPEVIVSYINKRMSENKDLNLYVTFFAGVLDLSSGKLQYCSAGHEPPVVIGDDAVELPFIPAFAVGSFDDTVYQAMEYMIEPDSTLFLFTDGLTEANDSERHMFERERIMDVARQAIAENLTFPQPLIEKMTAAVESFVGSAEQSDDLTLFAIRRLSGRSISLKASADEYPRLTAFVKSYIDDTHLDISKAGHLRMIVEEAVGNIIDYSGATNITITVGVRDGRLSVTFSDDGRPFDPTKVSRPDINVSGEERQIGGLGILYMREMSDSQIYRREDNQNLLIIVIK